MVPLSRGRFIQACRYFYQGWYLGRSCTMPDEEYYALCPDARGAPVPPIAHYILYGAKAGVNPNHWFDTKSYLAQHPGLSVERVNPLYHYLKTNRISPRIPEVSSHHALTNSREHFFLCPLHPDAEIRRNRLGTPGKPKAIFVGHEASRTGAPLILLRILEHFAKFPDLECILFLPKGGDLVTDYQNYAHVIVGSEKKFNLLANDLWIFREVLKSIAEPKPKFALVNTACVDTMLPHFQKMGIPVVNLVHEYLRFWPKEKVAFMYASVDRMVFPARFMMESANEHVSIPKNLGFVIPQGLIQPHFLNLDKQSLNQQSRLDFDIPQDAFVVMGCGTLDLRKGVDRFIAIAIETLARNDSPEVKDIHFVWMGGEAAETPYKFIEYCREDLHNARIEDRVHFLGQQRQPERVFAMADVFLMTSRNDPFPCVIHEAMALRIPVITFESCGGSPEAVAHGGGIVLPYHQISRAAETIVNLCSSPSECKQIGDEGRASLEKNFLFDRYFTQLVGLLQNELNVELPEISVSVPPKKRGKTPKVYFSTPDLGISGVNTLAFGLVRHLNELGIDASLLLTQPANRDETDHIPDIPYTYLTGISGLYGEDLWLRLKTFLESQAPCIFIPNYDYAASAVSPALNNKVGVIGIVHSDDIEHYEHAYRLGRYWNGIICVSKHILKEVQEMNPSFEPYSYYVRSGIEDIPPTPVVETLEEGAPIHLIYTGRLVEHQKRVRFFVKIAKVLKERKINYKLTLIGDGDEMPYLQRELRNEIRSGVVELPGRLPYSQIRLLLDHANVFLLVSEWEGTPISLMEGMAHACVPVVADIRSGVPEMVQHEKNGFIFNQQDAEALADAIAIIYNDRDRLAEMQKAAHLSIVEGGYSSISMAKDYAKIIREIHQRLEEGTYERPKSLHYLPHIGYIAQPPYMNLQGHVLTEPRDYWDLRSLGNENRQHHV